MTDYTADLALFVDGSWRIGEGRDAHTVVNPATGCTIAELPLASAADLDEALAAAERGFAVWRATDVEMRGGILRKAASLMRERADVIAFHLVDPAELRVEERHDPAAQHRFDIHAAVG